MKLKIRSQTQKQIIDITPPIKGAVGKSGFKNGLIAINVLHTTCAVTIAELDPGTDKDLLDFLESLIPNIDWRHSHDPGHVPSHLLSTLIGTTLTLPFENSQIILGTWQSIVLIELDGPRDRELNLSLLTSKK